MNQSFCSDTRGVSGVVAVILFLTVMVFVMTFAFAIVIDVTALEGTNTNVSGAVNDVTVDDKDINMGVEMEFNVSVTPGEVDRIEIYQQNATGDEKLVAKTGVLEEESSVLLTVGDEDYARTGHRVVAYTDGEVIGDGHVTVQFVSTEKSFKQAYETLTSE
mgnify:CR=1 FL=1